jgi:Flp pilus assembly protein TadG
VAQASVEFALVLPFLVLLITGSLAFGQTAFAYAQLLQAAQEGARYGAVLPYTRNDAAITTRAQQFAPGGTNDPVAITATQSPTNNGTVGVNQRTRGNVLTVVVQHRLPLYIPFFQNTTINLRATSSMVIEQTS